MKFSYIAKCGKCGNTREVIGFKRKIRKFEPTKAALVYVKCPKCGKRTRHEVIQEKINY